MTRNFKSAFALATFFSGISLFGCGDDSAQGASTEEENVCGNFSAYEDGSGNTHCIDAATGNVVYSVLSDGSIVYASTGISSGGLSESSSSGTEISICGETSAPVSIVGNFYFYGDGNGSYYYDIADAECNKNYLNEVSSSSSLFLSSSENVSARSSSSAVSNGNNPTLIFDGANLSIGNDNQCVDTSGTVVKILCAGEYNLTGASENFEIVVVADTSAKVYLHLNGLTLKSPNDAAIYVQSADKAFLVLSDGTENHLEDASGRTLVWNYTDADGDAKSDTAKAVVYAKKDLTIKGSGSLSVKSACADTSVCGNGIHTTKDLKIKGSPTITVTAKKNALKGKRSVEIENGLISLTSTDGDGIKSDEDDAEKLSEGKGFVKILGGTLVISAGGDGIDASNYVLIADSVGTPSLTITTGSGIANTTASGNGGMNPGFGGGCGWSSSSSNDESSVKGIKADSAVKVLAGTFVIKAEGDAVHSNRVVNIDGGYFDVSGRNGIHADDTVNVNGGTFLVTNSYEGFEGFVINLNGGFTSVYATDDGWNASSGNEGVGYLYVNGGTHLVYAAGDGLDSNGDLYMNDGVVFVQQSNGGGNGIFDIGDGNYKLVYRGGILVGVGTSDMSIGNQISGSYSGFISLSAGAGELVTVADEGGNVVAAMRLSSKTAASAGVFMVPNASSYSFYVGGTFNGSLEEDSGATGISYATSGTVSGGTKKTGSSSGGRW